MSNPRCIPRLFVSSSLLATLLLLFITLAFTPLFQLLINSQMVLSNGTLSFTQWLAPTPPIYKIVTVYNVTNRAVVEEGGDPVLQAMGPYYFREYRVRVDVEVVYDMEVRFGERKWYLFDEAKTNENRVDKLDPFKDKFTTFNIPYIGVAYNLTCSGASMNEKRAVIVASAIAHEQGVFMTKIVRDVVFGFTDPFLEALKIAIPSLPSTVQLVYNMSEVDITKTSRVRTGRVDRSKLGRYSEWQGFRKLPYWGSEDANKINGTEGIFFSPNLDKTKMITTFVDDLVRSNPMEFVSEEEVMTLNTYKYQIPKYILQNAENNPLNRGFYSFGPDGLMNMTAPRMAPVFASKPSFMDAESWLIDEISGLPPADRSTMETNIWVEPSTGLLVKAVKQLQANMMIQKMADFPGLAGLRERPRYVPIANILETGGMDEELVELFRKRVVRPKLYLVIGIWSLVGVGFLVSGASGCYLACVKRKGRRLRNESTENSEGDGYAEPLLVNGEGSQGDGEAIYESFAGDAESTANIYQSI